MTGGILQLVSNSDAPGNKWLIDDPQITFFKTVYRRHTPFATESVEVAIPHLDFGKTTSFTIPYVGDLVHRIYLEFDLPRLEAVYSNKKSVDVLKVLSKLDLIDTDLQSKLVILASPKSHVEFDQIFEQLDIARNKYISTQNYLLKTVDLVKNYRLSVYTHPSIKLDIYDRLLEFNYDYKPIYELVKLFLKTSPISNELVTVFEPRDIPKYVISNCFYNDVLSLHNLQYPSMLSMFNTLITVFKLLSKTVPIVLFKYFNKNHNQLISSSLTLIDPNFRHRFIRGVYADVEDDIDMNGETSPYYRLFIDRASVLHESCRSSIDKLFDTYSDLFTSINNMYYDNNSNLTGAFAWITSNNDRVFNLNTWYSYFFQYLDKIDQHAFSLYVKNSIRPSMLQSTSKFIQCLIILLKINIEYYITEASYISNDMYSQIGSEDPTVNMKNYIPKTRQDLGSNVFGLSIIFHRNHVPSISEIFQFIDSFLSEITIEMISQYLDIEMDILDPREETFARNICRELYSSIYNYYCETFNDLNIGLKLDTRKCLHEDIVTYVEHFFGIGSIDQCYNQAIIGDIGRNQTEFYFSLEIINEQNQNAFYNDMLTNTELLNRYCGQDVANIITGLDLSSYQHYSTRNISRYYGESYTNTSYKSRSFDKIIKAPIASPNPVPHSFPYGANQSSYDHCHSCGLDRSIDVHITSPLTSNRSILPTDINFFTMKHIFLEEQFNCNQFNQLEYDINDLINYNRKANSFIASNSTSPVDKAVCLRNMWLVQYAFSEANRETIDILKELESFVPKTSNTSSIAYEIISIIDKNNDYELLNLPTSTVFLFPDAYPEQTRNIRRKLEQTSGIVRYILSVLGLIGDGKPVLTVADVIDTINTSFSSCSSLRCYKDLDVKYLQDLQPLLTAKIEIMIAIEHAFNGKPNIDDLVSIAARYDLDENIFRNYLVNIIAETKDDDFISIITRISRDIDSMILGEEHDDTMISIKATIIDTLFSNIRTCASLVSGDHYAFLLYALNIDSSFTNPFLVYHDKLLKTQSLKSLLESMIDIVVDHATSIDQSISSLFDKIQDEKIIGQSNRSDDIVSMLSKADSLIEFEDIIGNKQSDNPVKKQSWLDTIIEHYEKRLIVTKESIQQLDDLENTLSRIVSRSKKAETAWIRKLAHFMVERVSFKRDNDVAETHVSEWFDVNSELFYNEGTIKSYQKMIGHTRDMYEYNSNVKNARTIVLPLIFYFNKDIGLSIPMSASQETEYTISIQLRSFDDIAYKSEYSHFVNELGQMIIPRLEGARAIIEYIYIGKEERKIFANNYLQYLINEIQSDYSSCISDSNTKPVYKTDEFTETKECNSVRYVDVEYTNKKDKHGLSRLQAVEKTVGYVHRKRATIINHFKNPTKYLVMLVRPSAHTDIEQRKKSNNYFYGEKQFANYGLHPYYDMSNVFNHYRNVSRKIAIDIMNIDDPVYGFIPSANKAIDHLLTEETSYDKIIVQFIRDLISVFSETDHLYYQPDRIRLLDNLFMLDACYSIVDVEIFNKMIDDVAENLGITVDRKTVENVVCMNNLSMNKTQFIHNLKYIFNRQLENHSINQDDIVNVANHVFSIYSSSVNFLLLNKMQYVVDSFETYNIRNIVKRYIDTSLNTDFTDRTIDQAIIAIVNKLETIDDNVFNSKPVLFSSMLDIVVQLISKIECFTPVGYYQISVPYSLIKNVSKTLIKAQNIIIDTTFMDNIDYSKLVVSNPDVNPMKACQLVVNGVNIKPDNTESIFWSETTSFSYANRTPSTGINLHSWALFPNNIQPSGSINLSSVNDFRTVIDVDPSIGSDNPATVITMVSSINLLRYIGGMCGRIFSL